MKGNILMSPYIYLAVIVAGAVGVRVILPYTMVFGEYIKFICPDSYYHMAIIAKAFPTAHQYQLWDWLIAGLAWLLGGGNPAKEFVETIAVFAPPVLAGFTVYFVYLIGSRLFNRWAGVVAALVVAFIPGEYFGRSVLGAIDHHVAEVFFTTGVMAFVALAWKSGGWRWWVYTTLGAVFLFAYASTWQGYPLFVMILGIYAVVILGIRLYRRKDIFLSALALTGGVALALSSGMIGRVVSALSMSPLTRITTSEAVGTLGIEGIIGLVLPKCLLALLLLAPLWRYKELGDIRWLLIVWSLVIVGATLWQRRFDYYLVVPLSLLIGFIAWRAYEALLLGCSDAVKPFCKGTAVLSVVIILAVCLVITIPGAKSGYRVPSDDWQEALIWVRDNTPVDTLIVTWWDYGYWVRYIGERGTYVTGSQGGRVERVARLFNSAPGDEVPGFIHKIDSAYIMIDERIITEYMEAIRIWDGGRYTERTLAQRLYEGSVAGFELVYDSEVKVFRRR